MPDEQSSSYATRKNWITSFKRGKVSIKNEDRSGRIALCLILSDRQIGIKEILEALNNSYEYTFDTVYIDLAIDTKLSAKWIQMS